MTPRFFPEFSSAFSDLLTELRGQPVAVVGHARPDGDCIGSQVALCRTLLRQGIRAECVNTDKVPRRLAFIVGDTPFHTPATFPAEGEWRSVFVDCADRARPGDAVLRRFGEIFANIDHHLSNTRYGGRNLVDARAAATAEILAGLFLDRGLEIDAVTAQALYVGMVTDTGQFRFSSTSRRVFALAGELLDRGADPARAGYELYEQESVGKLKLLRHYLESLELLENGRLCLGVLPEGIFEQTGATQEDTEGLVDYARSVEGVDIGALVEVRSPSEIKASLRCKDAAFRVDRVAAHFGGGGHACAAGLTVKLPLKDFYPQLVAALKQQLVLADSRASA